MNIISRIAWGNVDAIKEVYDWCSEEVLYKIKSQFTEIKRPTLFDDVCFEMMGSY